MDLEEAAKAAGVIPKAKIGPFLEYQVRYPGLPGLLEKPHATESRLQGDLIKNLPSCIIDETGMPRIAHDVVVLINNTCDLQPQRAQLINVALVVDYKEFKQGVLAEKEEKSALSYLRDLQRNHINELIYIPNCPGFYEGAVILLDSISSISAELYEAALRSDNRVASFSQNGFFVFLLKLANYFARPETPDVTREYSSAN